MITQAEYDAMVVPTVLRDPGQWVAAVGSSGLPFEVVDREETEAPEPAFTSYRGHGDRERFAADAVAAFRAWSERALMSGLSATPNPDDRRRAADAFYDRVRRRLAEEPVECSWRIALMRLRRL